MRWVMACLLFTTILMPGCGEPALYPISGKITLGGKPYERLLVYFHPIDRKASAFSVGVGETTNDGTLSLRSSAGNGLVSGKYRVSFACYVLQGSKNTTVGLDSEKADDDRTHVTKDIVPSPYNSPEESPLEFTVSSKGNNFLEFDIPKG